jgi:hypothetical protein
MAGRQSIPRLSIGTLTAMLGSCSIYLDSDVRKQASAANPTDAGARLNAFVLRTQVAFKGVNWKS